MSTQNTPSFDAAEVDAILNGPGGYSRFVRTLFNRSGDLAKDFAHAVLGLSTECVELKQATDEVNAVEEVSDLLFYLEALQQVAFDFDPIQVTDSEVVDAIAGHYAFEFAKAHSPAETLEFCLNQLEDIAKRWVGYGKAPAVSWLNIVLVGEAAIIAACDMSLLRRQAGTEALDERAKRVNVAKLLKRYKGAVFNADLAVDRDLTAERRVLEDAAAS
jgi:hypothetical protein